MTLAEPATVLLEVAASLQLFRGLPSLLRQQRAALAAMGHSVRMAVAPTPLAATWLARAGIEKIVNAAQLEQRLAPLPVALLDDVAEQRQALAHIGVRTLGQLLALPRAGVLRRFGPALLQQVDQALGQRADPRLWYVPPSHFRSRLDLPAELSQVEALLFPARRLILQLCAYLAGSGQGVSCFRVELEHGEEALTLCIVGLAAAAADAEHFLRLLRERLQRLVLSRPVSGLGLAADIMVPLRAATLCLFEDGTQAPGEAQKLIEQLRARLGQEAVYGVAVHADHRPERACLDVAPASHRPPSVARFAARPLWLLAQPQALAEVAARPQYQGELTLLVGPERIESGWWDGDIKRDYFLAQNSKAALLWIYREYQLDGRWYLHGFFA